MSDQPRTYGEIADLINEYFADLVIRVDAARSFCLAIVQENALNVAEIQLLQGELEDKFKLDTTE